METVAAAYSSHKFCFICKEKNLSLHRVKKPDIIYAYVNHKIRVTFEMGNVLRSSYLVKGQC